MKENGKAGGLIVDVVYGLAAGVAATFVMGQVSTYGYSLEDEKTRQYEENLRHKEYPPEVLAGKVAKAVTGRELGEQEKQKLGMAVHWAYGIGWGDSFGALRRRHPVVGAAGGVGFGLALWLVGDEAMMPLLGLSPPSTAFPWQNHARALVNHLAYGSSLAAAYSLLGRLRDAD